MRFVPLLRWTADGLNFNGSIGEIGVLTTQAVYSLGKGHYAFVGEGDGEGTLGGVGYSNLGGRIFRPHPIPNASVNLPDGADARYGAFPSPQTWYVTAGNWPSSSVDKAPHNRKKYKYVSQHLRINLAEGRYERLGSGAPAPSPSDASYNAAILKTTDAGKTWTKQFQDRYACSVWALFSLHGIYLSRQTPYPTTAAETSTSTRLTAPQRRRAWLWPKALRKTALARQARTSSKLLTVRNFPDKTFSVAISHAISIARSAARPACSNTPVQPGETWKEIYVFGADKGGSVLAVSMLSETEAWVATTYSKSILDNGAAMLHTTDGNKHSRTYPTLQPGSQTLPVTLRRQDLGRKQDARGRGRRHCVNCHQRNMCLRLCGDHRTGALILNQFTLPSHLLSHNHATSRLPHRRTRPCSRTASANRPPDPLLCRAATSCKSSAATPSARSAAARENLRRTPVFKPAVAAARS